LAIKKGEKVPEIIYTDLDLDLVTKDNVAKLLKQGESLIACG
jgi:ribose transport system substrate-binding protein